MKWARGVFELLQTVYPRVFARLSWGQRLSYAVRMTKYWIGPVVCLHMLATILVLMFAGAGTRAAFHEYLDHIAPLAVFDMLIRFASLRKWRHSETPRTSLFRAITLVYATWPIYTLAWVMALLRLPLAFRPTPKGFSGAQNPAWLLPQTVAVLLLVAGIVYTVFVKEHPLSMLLLFATLQGVIQLVLMKEWLLEKR
jgi:hypothetical protein